MNIWKKVIGILTAASISGGTYYFANRLYGSISGNKSWCGISGSTIAILASVSMFLLLLVIFLVKIPGKKV